MPILGCGPMPTKTWHNMFLVSLIVAAATWLAAGSLSLPTAAAAAAAAPSAAQCQLIIEGQPGKTEDWPLGQVRVANISCKGGPVPLGLHPQLLNSSRHHFHGVKWSDDCAMHGCLLTICGHTHVVFTSSTISGVNDDSESEDMKKIKSPGSMFRVVCVRDEADVTFHQSVVRNNIGTAIVAFNSSRVTLSGSKLLRNVGFLHAGGLSATDAAAVVITDRSEVRENTKQADVLRGRGSYFPVSWQNGGGLQVLGRASIVVSNGSSVRDNTCNYCAGGGAGLAEHGELSLTNGSSLTGNHVDLARSGGGGISMLNQSRLILLGNSSVANNTVGTGPGGGMVLEGNATAICTGSTISGNQVTKWSTNGVVGGAGVSMSEFSKLLLTGCAVTDNVAGSGLGGGILARNSSTVVLTGSVHFERNMVVAGLGRDVAVSNGVMLTVGNGVLQDGRPMSKCSSGVHLGAPPCDVGEYNVSGVCRCCPVHTYSFKSNATTCAQCPAHSFCAGGDRVVPVVGFWHSSPRSVQMHKCPLGALSCGDNGTCLAGYTGHLCGACREGYGLSLPLRCSKCLAAGQQVALYVLMFCGCSALVAYTVHATWQDNKAGGKDLRPSDLLKVLAQFLQYLVILGSISAPWPAFLGSWFAAAAVVFGATGGQSSLDCWLKQLRTDTRLPLAIQRQLVAFLAPVGVLLAVVLLLLAFHWLGVASRMCCVGRVRGRQRSSSVVFADVLTRLRVAMLVVAFYAYPTLVKASLSFFACLPVDTAGKQPYPEYAVATHPSGYWVSDIHQECFAGWHKPWALGLGLPTVVVLCVGVPVMLLWFLWANAHKTTQPCFQELYGFLYRNYSDKRLWWEAIWALQTVVLTAVSVFHFTLRAYYALLLMGLVLLLSAAVQQAAQPYRHKQLHRLHMGGTACLYLNIWLALNLFAFEGDEPSLTPLHTAVGAIMVVLDAAFVAWCLYSIARLAHPTLLPVLHQAVGWVKKRALSLPCRTAGARACCC